MLFGLGLRWPDPWPVPAKHIQLGSLLNSSKRMLHLDAVERCIFRCVVLSLPSDWQHHGLSGLALRGPGLVGQQCRRTQKLVPTALVTFLPLFPVGETWQKLRMRNISGLQQTRPGHRATYRGTVASAHLMHSFPGLFASDAVSLKATPRPHLRRTLQSSLE